MIFNRHPCTGEAHSKHLNRTGVLEDTQHFLNPRRLSAMSDYGILQFHMRKVYNNVH